MNPIAFILLGVAAYALLQQQQKQTKKDEPKKDEPKPGAPTPEDTAKFQTTGYNDSAGLTWKITSKAPDDWTAKIYGDAGDAYDGPTTITASSRPYLIMLIEKAVKKSKAEVLEVREDGEDAGIEDANASVKAYEDSWTGYGVKTVHDRLTMTKGDAWVNGYWTAFRDRLEELGYYIGEGSTVKKEG